MKLTNREKDIIKSRRKYIKTLRNNVVLIKKRKKAAASKGERAVIQFLQKEGVEYVREYYFKGLYNSTKSSLLFFDFYLPGFNLCIEFDGAQHYAINKPQRQKENDFLKNAYCLKNNIHFLRIKWVDVDKVAGLICSKIDIISPIV